ncbi:NAD(P)/FAD-dependent oxidoreductase [Azospirillum halopraeferens]|uniref:NAD(P)/FAD-dependent oxidoreductase n=1 Tax=Azospirillum halopraeferens TaxID=34010 RepID=UPI00041801D3|nr:FAD-dependent monooxygenase [Azospirillum halopraeferens]
MTGTEVLVVGGGPAGAAAAAWLAAAGRRVLLAERTAGPHQKVCGEFLSGEAVALVRGLGVDPAAAGARPVECLRLVRGGAEAVAALPFPALSVGRDVLDEALLAAARRHGAEVRRGAAVRRLTADGAGVRALLGDGAVTADAAVLATGKHDLHGHRRPPPAAAVIGFKQHWRLAPGPDRALDGHVEVHLFDGGYAGLQPAAQGRANLCLVVEAATYARLGRDWGALLAHAGAGSPRLAERLAGGTPCWPRPLAVAGLPYGWVHRDGGPAVLHRVGDQLAVIPSFCGDGMAIALDSARRAAAAVASGRPAGDGAPYARQVGLARGAARLLRAPRLAGLAVAALSLWPGPARWVARHTRVAG